MKSPLIVKWRYWNNASVSSGRAGNYLAYIGTRDGVELPETTYLNYIGTRPGVERQAEHGLFSDEGIKPVLSAEREKLKSHKGRVMTLIFSLSREDAEATGFNCATRWCSLMRTQKLELARHFGIPPEALRWYGAFHNAETHPHIHVLLYSTDPTRDVFLTRHGLDRIKSTFATEIFRHELDEIYREQTEQRNALTQIARDEIADLAAQIKAGDCDDPQLCHLMQTLAERLRTVKGKKAYAYMPPEAKALVDEITDQLAEDERIARLYALWYESKYAILRSYTAHMPPQKQLSKEATFKPIRNAVIRAALSLTQPSSSLSSANSTALAVTRLMRDASRIIEDRINGQLALHPELAVDSKLRREVEAKKHGVGMGMYRDEVSSKAVLIYRYLRDRQGKHEL